jgi:hypothetical protein
MAKQALISTIEPRYTGYRVAQVVDSKADTFEVANTLFWADCAENVVADQFWYNPDNQQIEPNPIVPPPTPTAEENKNYAIELLSETDWATIPDVADPAISNPYLTNQQAYFDYRNLVRPYTINPVAGNINWPTQPTPIWSNT